MHSRLHKRFAGLAAAVAVAVPLSLGVAPVAHAAPAPAQIFKQNYSDSIVPLDGIACNGPSGVLDTKYYRRYDLSQYGAANGVSIASISIGVETAASAGNIPGDVAVYAVDHAAPMTLASLGTPLGTATANLDSVADGTILTVPVAGTVSAGKDLVIVAHVATASADFFMGANEDPEVADTYLVAPDCGATEMTSLSDVGLDTTTMVFFASGKTTDCTTAETAAASAATAAATASAKVTKASKKVKHAKKSLKKAKKSHDANKIKHAKAKLKKAKKSLKKAKAASAAANAALATANANQNTKCAQPALPPAQARPTQGSNPSTGATNGNSFSRS